MIDHKSRCAKQIGGKCNCETPEPPMTPATISPETYKTPPTPPSGSGGIGHASERTELTVNDMTQHVYQHQAEPRDLEYRTQAFALAASVMARHSKVYTTSEVIQSAAKVEEYLRNGKS